MFVSWRFQGHQCHNLRKTAVFCNTAATWLTLFLFLFLREPQEHHSSWTFESSGACCWLVIELNLKICAGAACLLQKSAADGPALKRRQGRCQSSSASLLVSILFLPLRAVGKWQITFSHRSPWKKGKLHCVAICYGIKSHAKGPQETERWAKPVAAPRALLSAGCTHASAGCRDRWKLPK